MSHEDRVTKALEREDWKQKHRNEPIPEALMTEEELDKAIEKQLEKERKRARYG